MDSVRRPFEMRRPRLSRQTPQRCQGDVQRRQLIPVANAALKCRTVVPAVLMDSDSAGVLCIRERSPTEAVLGCFELVDENGWGSNPEFVKDALPRDSRVSAHVRVRAVPKEDHVMPVAVVLLF